jgi:protease-4
MGIKSQPVATHPFASFPSLDRTPTASELAVVQTSVNRTYNRFKQVVAEGRGLDPAVVDSIARGRVYSGSKAQALGLVDELGGLTDAITSCADLAGIESYSVEHVTIDEEPWRRALRDFGVSLRGANLEAQIRALHTKIQRLGGIQARETLLL